MRMQLIVLVLVGLGIAGGAGAWQLSRMGINQGYSPEQPIAFPHKVHAGDNKIPCLYCHYAARTSRHAGIPPASVCMNCHNIMEKQTVEIEKLKEAVQQDRPIRWVKIHNLPDFVYFNHSQHVLSGVQCQSCHGPIEKMVRVEQFAPLTMGWCLQCHREHAKLPTGDFQRALLSLSKKPQPVAGLDCTSCHY
ncbi:MAG TPA: cytochrome c3 family protein [Candidatus Angelobacter sp.]|nr:cytochrome c3 family protein [Candidatus Angelobacter sp.]